MAELNWTDAQWQKVRDCVTEAFGKASVASAFLPCYGPLPGSAEIVRNELVIKDENVVPSTYTVRLNADHDEVNLKLVNLTVNVLLSNEQVADETLSNAMLAFRRAANIIAQQEDKIVFDGFLRGPRSDDAPYKVKKVVVNDVEPQQGLADLPARQGFTDLTTADGIEVHLKTHSDTIGQTVVSAVVKAIHVLEDRMHPAPFACVLGNTLFDRVHDPAPSLVLPADRIMPLLKGGALLRSGKMDDEAGIVISLAGNAVDIVVGTPPTVQFIQRMTDAKFLFRVYERFALRIRDTDTPPVAGFRIRPTADEAVGDAQTLVELAERQALVPTAELRVAKARKNLAEVRKKHRGK